MVESGNGEFHGHAALMQSLRWGNMPKGKAFGSTPSFRRAKFPYDWESQRILSAGARQLRALLQVTDELTND